MPWSASGDTGAHGALGQRVHDRAGEVAAAVAAAWRARRGEQARDDVADAIFDSCASGTELIGRWLATGRPATAAERARLAATAQLAADERLPLTELAECCLGWRDGTVALLLEEAAELGTEAGLLQRATAMVARSCDGSLTELMRAFDARRRSLLRRLAAGCEQLAAVIDTTPAALLLLDEAGRLVRYNRAAEQLYGLPPHRDDAPGPNTAAVPLPGGNREQWARAALLWARARNGERLHDEPASWTRADGRELVLSVSTATVRVPTSGFDAPDPLGETGEEARQPAGVLAVVTDVTGHHRLERQLRKQSQTDELTGLPNRTLFTDRLEHAVAAQPDAPGTLAVTLIDLDGFKGVNDTGGHLAGDMLLHQTAARICSVLRRADTVARLGGDEFGVLLEATTAEGAYAAARAVLEAMRATVPLPDGSSVEVSGSIGLVVLDPADSADAEQTLADADLAMYAAKRAGGDRVAVFDPAMRAAIADRLARESELRTALQPEHIGEQIVVFYQPYIDLTAGPERRRVVGVEALVRWAHPTRGLLAPAEFIALAEDTGLIVPLGAHVLACAAAQARAWQRSRADDPHAAPLTVSVNLSVRQLADPGLLPMVEMVLASTGLPAPTLTLELTESVLATDDPQVVAVLHELKQLGVRLAVDDFGTGYSALSYLQRFPLDVLKVDRSFVRDLLDPDAAPLTASIIGIARTLGLGTVAEGIETAEQASTLRELGCATAQGFFFARPLPADRLTAFLDAADGADRSSVPAPRTARR